MGGGSKAPKPQPVKEPELPELPPPAPIPPPPAPLPPPATMSAQDEQQARQDQIRQAARRKGLRRTILAGESDQPSGGKTLLG